MSQFSLFQSKYNPGVSQYNHIHLAKGDVKDFDYTFAPTKIIDLTMDDDGAGDDDEYLPNIVYIDNNLGEKFLAGDDETEAVTVPQQHNPEDNNDITHRNDDQPNYQNEISDENLPTTAQPLIYHIENTEPVTEFAGDTFYIENIDRDKADHEESFNYIEDEPAPQPKSPSPNSGFKTDFFNSMNIENLVFSIPDQFREYLQEPPEWINKDYW